MNLKRMTFVANDSTAIIEPSESGRKHKVTVIENENEPYVRYLPLNNKGVKQLLRTRGVTVFLG